MRQERQGWPLDQAADARGRPISGMSALRRLRPRVRFGMGPKTTMARCRTQREIKRNSPTDHQRAPVACSFGVAGVYLATIDLEDQGDA